MFFCFGQVFFDFCSIGWALETGFAIRCNIRYQTINCLLPMLAS